jgi:hypothetical protein
LKPHKHAELIKAWADGAEIETLSKLQNCWVEVSHPAWEKDYEYRIKPMPDYIDYAYVIINPMNIKWTVKKWANLKFIWDGETGKLKTVEVI